MSCDPCRAAISLDAMALGVLMPMYLRLDPDGRIAAMGPTLARLLGDAALGDPFTEHFALRRPREMRGGDDLVRAPWLRLNLRVPPGTGFKGVAVPVSHGWLLNLSFGIDVPLAVRDHDLSQADFAPTDLAVELLYLVEAKAAVMAELARMNARLHRAKTRAEEEALTDTLTGLANRRALERELLALRAGGRNFALMHIDLDYFKFVNDTLGHAAGDHVLVTAAQRLRAQVRASDLVARVGGDEFMIVQPGVVDAGPVQRVGQAILRSLALPIAYDGQECRIAGSIGAVFSAALPDGLALDVLLEHADRALYASKKAGRGRLTIAGPDDFGLMTEVA